MSHSPEIDMFIRIGHHRLPLKRITPIGCELAMDESIGIGENCTVLAILEVVVDGVCIRADVMISERRGNWLIFQA